MYPQKINSRAAMTHSTLDKETKIHLAKPLKICRQSLQNRFNIFFFNLYVLLSFASSFRKIPLQLMDLRTTEMISWTRKIKKTNQCLLFNIPAAAASLRSHGKIFKRLGQLLCVFQAGLPNLKSGFMILLYIKP
jgi:hypothetical protein